MSSLQGAQLLVWCSTVPLPSRGIPYLHRVSVGSERETWSDSDDGDGESKTQQDAEAASQDPCDPTHLQFQLKRDGYESGDLGDISHAYVTEPPGSKDENSEQELDKDISPFLSGSGHAQKNSGHDQEGQSSGGHGRKRVNDGGGILHKMCELVNPDSGKTNEVVVSLPSEQLVQDILQTMWRYCHAYHISNSVSVFVCDTCVRALCVTVEAYITV